MNRIVIVLAILIPLATVFYVTMTPESQEIKQEKPESAAVAEKAPEADKKYTIEVTRDNVESIALESDQPVVLDFWAPWCGPCLMLGPHLEEIARDYEGVAIVGKVNTDDEQALAVTFRAESIPLVVIMKDGKVVKKFEGYSPKVPDQIRLALKKLIKP